MTALAKCALWGTGGTLALGGGATGGHFLREAYGEQLLGSSASQTTNFGSTQGNQPSSSQGHQAQGTGVSPAA
ncbi:hypothetical protein MHLP_02455 [Candidatus Mycoplasma haematolamae str. Purdue]|uniref:Uncharacterized protein n=1 Tax=Mycoplasma haematolamae (strain Purdue) TaxID=1212765 RepID=I7CFS7_MYCHA|nr:hypothetical protein [Candidatus Mycoplasma haematolamae]AFO52071.1 hypothetical protein MHLP_02455 [Candidatus Mycoplasma haematolamae str. Purdue]